MSSGKLSFFTTGNKKAPPGGAGLVGKETRGHCSCVAKLRNCLKISLTDLVTPACYPYQKGNKQHKKARRLKQGRAYNPNGCALWACRVLFIRGVRLQYLEKKNTDQQYKRRSHYAALLWESRKRIARAADATFSA